MHPTIFTKKLQVVHVPEAVPMSRSQASIIVMFNFNKIQDETTFQKEKAKRLMYVNISSMGMKFKEEQLRMTFKEE